MAQVGDRIPSATLLHKAGSDVTEVDISERTAGRRVVLFGLPGAYTATCDTAHLPSFVRTADAFRAKGIDEIICVSANDVLVMEHWGEASGANAAGITMLADWNSELAKGLELAFSVPAVGLKDRMTRCAMLIEDGEIKILQVEEDSGVCSLTAGESLLEIV